MTNEEAVKLVDSKFREHYESFAHYKRLRKHLFAQVNYDSAITAFLWGNHYRIKIIKDKYCE